MNELGSAELRAIIPKILIRQVDVYCVLNDKLRSQVVTEAIQRFMEDKDLDVNKTKASIPKRDRR